MVESIQYPTTSTLVIEATKHVKQLLTDQLSEGMTYHNWEHTQQVLNEVRLLGRKSQVSSKDLEKLELAALFHDTGFTRTYNNHEVESCIIAEEYLKETDYEEASIKQLCELIMSTRKDKVPEHPLAKILHDADTAHLGRKKYNKRIRNLRKEELLVLKKEYSDKEWLEYNNNFFQQHNYLTDVAKKEYGKRKKKNFKKIEKNITKIEQKKEAKTSISDNKAARMIFKTALRNHIDLTSIADQKANIMLSICAVILTLGMPLFATYMMDRQMLLVPASIFLITCALTMIFATMATRPIKTDGETDLSRLFSGRSNLFFFGNYYNIKLKDYQDAVKKVMENKNTLDNNIINDLYFLGLSLGRKFRILRVCYTIFMVGITLTIISFFLAYFLMPNQL